MNELHDETDGETDVKSTRVPWRRPSFRTVPAREAEVGVAVTVSDGAFTTS